MIIFLGIYSIPSFLYFLCILFFLLFFFFIKKKQFKNILKLFYSFIFIILLTCIFYSPVFFISGLDSIIGNKFVDSQINISFSEYFTFYFNKLPNYLFNSSMLFYLIIILSFFHTFILKKNLNKIIYIFIVLIFSLIIIYFHNIIPPERIFVFLIPPVVFLVSFFYYNINNKNLSIIFSILYLFLSSFLFYDSFKKIEKHHARDTVFKIASEFIIKNDPKKIFLNHGLLDTFIIYYGNDDINLNYSYSDYNSLNNKNTYDYFILNKEVKSDEITLENSYIMDKKWTHYNIYIYKNNNYEKIS